MRTSVAGLVAGWLLTLTACAPEETHRNDHQVYRDNEIQANAAFILQKEPELSDIRVRTFKREVTLTGTVEAEEHRKKAEDLVRSVRGVQSVVNQIIVNGKSVKK